MAADVLAHACSEARELAGATRAIACYAPAPSSWERGVHLEIEREATPLPRAARSAAFAVHRRLASARAALTLEASPAHETIFRGLGVPRDGTHVLRAVPLLHRTGRLVGEILLVSPVGAATPESAAIDLEIARIAAPALENVQRLATAKRAQERLLLLAETTNEALWDWEIATGELWWGGAIVALVGSSSELVQHKIEWKRGRMHPDDAPRVEASLAAALASTRSSWSEVYRFRRAAGEWAVVEDHAHVLRDADGRAYRLVGAMRDVTELHASSEALRRNEERLRAALEASDIGTYVWDVASGEVHADDGARRLFDFAAGEGGALEDHASRVHPEDRHGWWEAVRRTAREGVALHLEYRIVRPDGSVRWLLDRGRAVRDPGGATVAYVPGARMDVTARRFLEEARERASLRAIEANRAKDEFLAMLGHELRNPLSPMTTALHLLRTRGIASREIDVLERQVRHLTRLVDDLLDVSRITRGKVEIRRQPIDLGDVVARALEIASPLLEQRRHRVVVDAPPGVVVDGDAARLAQVVSNLVTNAAKYSDAGSEITVVARASVERAELRVVDRGVGIAPAMLERVFDMFVQQPQTLDRSHGGLGLGLAIVKSLVELHGGSVRVSSEVGRGSEFTIELPVSTEAARHDEASGTRAVPAGAWRVLVVDDNRDAAELLRDALVALGHSVAVAHDGPTALRVAEQFHPEIALLDIGLPVMDGYELGARLRAARASGAPLRLVAITGYGQREDHLRSKAAGFDQHLVKPLDLAQLAPLLGASRVPDGAAGA